MPVAHVSEESRMRQQEARPTWFPPRQPPIREAEGEIYPLHVADRLTMGGAGGAMARGCRAILAKKWVRPRVLRRHGRLMHRDACDDVADKGRYFGKRVAPIQKVESRQTPAWGTWEHEHSRRPSRLDWPSVSRKVGGCVDKHRPAQTRFPSLDKGAADEGR